jgi:predicted SAM-dependent methyltransferase
MELKPAVKKVARPAAQLVRRVVTRVVDPRLSALESEVQKLKDYVPAVLDAVSTQHAVTRVARREERQLWRLADEQAQRLAEAEQRTEFVRRELLFELRYGDGSQGGGSQGVGISASASASPAVEPKVLNEEKLRASAGDIRLNLGAGHVPVEGYLNVDARALDGIDIVADIQALPFGPAEVSVIFCAHLLEHFPLEQARRALLPYWQSLLQPGGRFVAVVPDSEAMLEGYAHGEISFAELREVTFGGQEYDGDFHFNMYSKESLVALLTEVGFVDAAITASARRNGLCYEMQVEARVNDRVDTDT